eukprot:1144733-Pelagomonas_calceolata.AAC.8
MEAVPNRAASTLPHLIPASEDLKNGAKCLRNEAQRHLCSHIRQVLCWLLRPAVSSTAAAAASAPAFAAAASCCAASLPAQAASRSACALAKPSAWLAAWASAWDSCARTSLCKDIHWSQISADVPDV